LKEEKERHNFTQEKYEKLSSRVKGELESKLTFLTERENTLTAENSSLLSELTEAKTQYEALDRKIREKDREQLELLEKQSQDSESKVKTRLDKIWMEKLKVAEDTAAGEVNIEKY